VRGARAAQCAWHILGQGALYQPAQDRVPVGGVRNDVPALVTRRRNPRRDHRVAQGVDKDGLQFPLCFVVLRSEAADPFQVHAAEAEAPPRGVRRPGEQPQRQIAIGKAQVRCNVGTCSCGEAPAIDAREHRAQADRRIEVGQRAAGAVVVDLADHGNHESELASPAGAGKEPVPFVRTSIMEGSGLHRHGAVAGLRPEPPWLQAMLLPVEPTGYAWRSLSAVPTAHRLLLGTRLPFANVHRYQTGRRGNHSQQANAAGGSVPSSWLHPGWPYEITPYLVANLPTHRNDAQLSPEQPQHRPQE
jgi:hypothetical protein